MSFSRFAPRLTALVLVSAAGAGAAPCGRPDVDLTFPPDGASSVPSNAGFSAHYGSPAIYADEPVHLTDASGGDVPLSISFEDVDSLLRAAPSAPLDAGSYHLVWPGLRGVGGSVGRGSTLDFSVSGVADVAAPSFAGLTGIDWDLARERDACTDKLDDRFVFRLQSAGASDDAGATLLSLLIFETRDPGEPTAGEPERVALRAFPAQGAVEVRRPATHAGSTCFAAVAQDLLGNVSGGGEREVCVTTKVPPFFDGCAVAAPSPGAGEPTWSWLGLLAATLRRRKRWQREPA